MVQCIQKLLQDGEEESLECLCTLLRTIGKQLEMECKDREKKGSKFTLNGYFDRLQDIVGNKQTSARIRFMILDILDMRENDWKVRKIQDENKPKTIDEIRAEAQKEQETQMHELHQHTIQKKMEAKKGRGDDQPWQLPMRKSQHGQQQPNLIPDFNHMKLNLNKVSR